jgi:hypothetical protein
MAVRQTERDVNKWYAPDAIDDGTFVSRTPSVPTDSAAHFTGRIITATTFGEFASLPLLLFELHAALS